MIAFKDVFEAGHDNQPEGSLVVEVTDEKKRVSAQIDAIKHTLALDGGNRGEVEAIDQVYNRYNSSEISAEEAILAAKEISAGKAAR